MAKKTQSAVSLFDDNDVNASSPRKTNNKKTKNNDKPSTNKNTRNTTNVKSPTGTKKKSIKPKKADTELIENSNTESQKKPRVGRKDWKHGYMEGLDQVWVDGIDHWVCKTAFRNEANKTPVYTLNNYVQGLDSYWVMRYIPPKVNSRSDDLLENLNNELDKHYKSWEEASKNWKISEEIISRYKDYISWKTFLTEATKHNRKFTAKFQKKFSAKFMLLTL